MLLQSSHSQLLLYELKKKESEKQTEWPEEKRIEQLPAAAPAALHPVCHEEK